MHTDNLLSEAKAEDVELAPTVISPSRTLLAERPFGSLYKLAGEELPFYEVKGEGMREKLSALLSDADVQAIHFADGVTLNHRRYGPVNTDVTYKNAELNRALPALAKKFPFEIVQHGSTVVVQKIHQSGLSLIDLINNGGISLEAASFLWACIEGKNQPPANILISAPTALRFDIANALSCFIPANERVSCIGASFVRHSSHWHRADGSIDKTAKIGIDRIVADLTYANTGEALDVLEGGCHAIYTVPGHSAQHAFESLVGTGKATNLNVLITAHATRIRGKKLNAVADISEVIPAPTPEVRHMYAFEKGEMHLQNPFGSFFLHQTLRFGVSKREIETDLEEKAYKLQELNKAGLRSWEEIRRAVTGQD